LQTGMGNWTFWLMFERCNELSPDVVSSINNVEGSLSFGNWSILLVVLEGWFLQDVPLFPYAQNSTIWPGNCLAVICTIYWIPETDTIFFVWEDTTSNTKEGNFSFPLQQLYRCAGHISQKTCMQLAEPTHRGSPTTLYRADICAPAPHQFLVELTINEFANPASHGTKE
jgi:hypothetical protein